MLYVPDQSVTDSVVGCYGPMCSFILSDGKNLFFCQLGFMVAFSNKLTLRATPTFNHILSVLSLGARNDVRRIHANSVVANMPQNDTLRSAQSIYSAISLFVGFYMGRYMPVLSPKPAVSGSCATEPRPAFIRSTDINVTPELRAPVFQRFFAAMKLAGIRAKFRHLRSGWIYVENFSARCANYLCLLLPACKILAEPLAVVFLSEARWKFLKILPTAITLHGDLFDRHVPCPDVCVPRRVPAQVQLHRPSSIRGPAGVGALGADCQRCLRLPGT